MRHNRSPVYVEFIKVPECDKCTTDIMLVKEYGAVVFNDMGRYCPSCALYLGFLTEEEYARLLLAEEDLISLRKAMVRLGTGKSTKIVYKPDRV